MSDDNEEGESNGRVTLALVRHDIKDLKKDVSELTSDVRTFLNRVQELELRIQGNEIKLDNLVKDVLAQDDRIARLQARDIIGTVATAIATIIAVILTLVKR